MTIDQICIFCLRHQSRWEGEQVSSCSYGLNHELFGQANITADTQKQSQKAQHQKRRAASLCSKCNLHPRNPLFQTNGCDHIFETDAFARGDWMLAKAKQLGIEELDLPQISTPSKPKLVLRMPTNDDEASFLAALKDWKPEEVSWFPGYDWKDNTYFTGWDKGSYFQNYLTRLAKNSRGEDLPNGFVPSSMFFGFVGNTIVGRLHFRHRLNDQLMLYGGNISYAIATKHRNRGYATEMLRQLLPICRAHSLYRVLLTCDETNLASIRVIEKLGCKLQDTIWDQNNNRHTRRYWLETSEAKQAVGSHTMKSYEEVVK